MVSSAACAGSPGDYEQANYATSGDVAGVRLRDGRGVTFGYDEMGRRKTTTFVNPVDLIDSNVRYAYDGPADAGAGRQRAQGGLRL